MIRFLRTLIFLLKTLDIDYYRGAHVLNAQLVLSYMGAHVPNTQLVLSYMGAHVPNT